MVATSFAWRPDGKSIISSVIGAGGGLVIGTINAATGETQAVGIGAKKLNIPAHAVDLSPDGRTVVSRTRGAVEFFDAQSYDLLATTHSHNNIVSGLAWSPDGKILAFGQRKSIYLCSTQSGAMLRNVPAVLGWVDALIWSPDGMSLGASDFSAGVLAVIPIAGGPTIRWTGMPLTYPAWSTDGKAIAYIDKVKNTEVRVVSALTGEFIKALPAPEDSEPFAPSGAYLTWSPDGKQLALAQARSKQGGTVLVWNVESGEVIHQLVHQKVGQLAWSPDGLKLLAHAGAKEFKVWDTQTGQLLRTIAPPPPAGSLYKLAWNSDSTVFACGRARDIERMVDLWDSSSGTLLRSFKGHHAAINPGCALLGNSRLFSGLFPPISVVSRYLMVVETRFSPCSGNLLD